MTLAARARARFTGRGNPAMELPIACPQILTPRPFNLWVPSADNQWCPLYEPIPIVANTTASGAVAVIRATGNARVTLAYMLFKARALASNAAASVASGGYNNTSGTTVHNTIDLSGTTDMFLLQLGVIANLSGGATPGYIQGVVYPSVSRCMQVLPGSRITV